MSIYQSQLILRARHQAMRAKIFTPSIELGSRSSIYKSDRLQRPNRQESAEILGSNPRDYQPQVDNEDDEDPESPPEMADDPQLEAQDNDFCARILKDKGAKLLIILMLCLYIFDFFPVYRMGHDMFEFREGSIKKKQDPGALRFMSANLNADPIMDIKILEKGSACPAGYRRLKLGTWPGTVEGCLCENGDLHRTSCDKVGSEKCNKDIQETSPLDMYDLNDSIWCVKRAVLGTDYVREAKCPFASKECYVGGCFAETCPITKVEIAPHGDLILTRTQGELPLINIQITFDDIPCFTQQLFDQSIKNSSYELAAMKQDKCDKYGFSYHFTTKITSQTAYESFVQNSLPDSVMKLPYFEENSNSTFAILSSMTQMKVAQHDHCLDINEKVLSNFTGSWHNYTLFIFLVFIVLLIFRIISICHILCYLSSCFKAEDSEDSSELEIVLYQLNFLSCVPVIIIVILFYFLYAEFQILKHYFGEYDSLECFAGGQGSMVINDYLKIVESIGDSFSVELALLYSWMFSGAISLWFSIRKLSSSIRSS